MRGTQITCPVVFLSHPGRGGDLSVCQYGCCDARVSKDLQLQDGLGFSKEDIYEAKHNFHATGPFKCYRASQSVKFSLARSLARMES